MELIGESWRACSLGQKGSSRIYLGDSSRDGHASSQKEREDGGVADHGRAASQWHEVVPVVGILQDGLGCLLAASAGNRVHCSLPQCVQLLQQKPVIKVGFYVNRAC